MKDRFGREIIKNEDGTFSVLDENGDVSITVEKAHSLDAMAPPDWVFPSE